MAWSDDDIATSAPAKPAAAKQSQSKSGWSDEDVAELERINDVAFGAQDTSPAPSSEIDPNTGQPNPDAETLNNVVDQTVLPLIGGTGAYKLGANVTAKAAGPLVRAVASRFPRIGGAIEKVLPMSAGGAASGAVEEGMAGRDIGQGAAYGAMLGPVFEGSIAGLSGLYGGARDLTGGTATRVSKKLRSVFDEEGGRRQAAVDALRNRTPSGVIGEQSTVGSLASAEFPEFGAFESMYRQRPGAHRFSTIDAQNEAARADMLEPFAQHGRPSRAQLGDMEKQLSPSEVNRKTITTPLYDRAGFDRMPIDDRFNKLLGTPGPVQDAITQGVRRFENKRDSWSYQGGKARPKKAKLDSAGNIEDISIAEMHTIREELDLRANAALKSTDPATVSQGHELKDVRDALTRQMEKHSDNYRHARSEYARLSQPVNESHLMEELTKRLRNPYGIETPGSYGSALRNQEDTLTSSAVGRPRFKQFEQVLSDDAQHAVDAVGESLRRKAYATAQPRNQGMLGNQGGSLEDLADSAPPIFNQYMTVARKALKVAGAKMGKQEEKLLGDAVANPDEFARLLEMVPPSERDALKKVVDYLRQPAAGFGTAQEVQDSYEDK